MNILRIDAVLSEKGITGKELAGLVDVTPTSISRIVTGQTFPKPDLLLKISKVLDVDVRELFHPTKDQTGDVRDIYVKDADGKDVRIGEINTTRL